VKSGISKRGGDREPIKEGKRENWVIKELDDEKRKKSGSWFTGKGKNWGLSLGKAEVDGKTRGKWSKF